MVFWLLGYLTVSIIICFIASYPFLDEMRNQKSLYENIKRVLVEKKPGAKFLLCSFVNLFGLLLVVVLFFPKG